MRREIAEQKGFKKRKKESHQVSSLEDRGMDGYLHELAHKFVHYS
jgi:hypothetical protein